MENKIIKKGLFDSITYEVIERLTRFILHISEIESQFYSSQSKKTSRYDLIANYKDTLLNLLEMSVVCYKKSITKTQITLTDFNLQKDIFDALNALHREWLSILPRPSEPIELTRFERVIFKQIVLLDDKKDNSDDIILSINESTGEQITRSHPLDPFVEVNVVPIIEKIKNYYNHTISRKQTTSLHHITIPRVDAGNPFRWSSLIHEMSHYLMADDIFKTDISSDFIDFVNSPGKENILSFLNSFLNNNIPESDENLEKVLNSWLVECWCDLFACILIGPSLYFSQYLAFINDDNDCRTHPPASFRLLLIQTILSHRFAVLYQNIDLKYFNQCEQLINVLETNKTNWTTSGLTYIFSSFKNYFITHFFTSSGDNIDIDKDRVINAELNEKLKLIVRKYVTLSPDIIDFLTNQLKYGLPIPSFRITNKHGDYEEVPTYVQEIFLASWIVRFKSLQGEILQAINEFDFNISIDDFFSGFIKKNIERHDQAVLKSIQVSEWFDLFNKEKIRQEDLMIWQVKDIKLEKEDVAEPRGTLVDSEIKELIYSNELQIIPLINLDEQLGTTSIDIRLGTCFQLFSPDEYGIIDFTNTNSESYYKLSRKANFDFVEGITISPGQFLLGHSMEYIKLPNDVCANLEGRSSFARLGIEIHITAGFIDPGFEGVITFEIYNAGASAVKLYPGLRIGQLRLERISCPAKLYKDRHTVKYKGLLEHHVSRQSQDSEISIIQEHLEKNNKK